MIITFNELRRVKHSLPAGSIQKIADIVGTDAETVRNYFGASHYDTGMSAGINVEIGPEGGMVQLEDLTIWNLAMKILEESKIVAD